MANTATANNIVPSLSTDFNRSPYYDDFDASKDFHRMLFLPSVAVQARELTQMQTMLQHESASYAAGLWKDGSLIRGGQFSTDLNAGYVKLADTDLYGNTVTANNFLNSKVIGSSSAVQAVVIATEDGQEALAPNTKTLIVKYVSAGSNSEIREFTGGETITSNTGFVARVYSGANALGVASTFSVRSGHLFSKGLPVRFPDQMVILDKYSGKPSARTGFIVSETIVTHADDVSLVDPAAGYYNEAAPGAHRAKVYATLVSYPLTANVPAGFIEASVYKDGILQQTADRPLYSDILDTMALRTYAESGDYTVSGSRVRVRDHLNTGSNDGYLTAAEGGNSYQLAVGIEPGTLFVKGYEYTTLVTQYKAIDRGIDYIYSSDVSIGATSGNYVMVNEMSGVWDVHNGTTVRLYDEPLRRVSTRGYSAPTPGATQLGTARVKSIAFETGTPGTNTAQYRLYLYDVSMSNAAFSAVRSVWMPTSTVAAPCADIVVTSANTAKLVDATYATSVYPIPNQAIRAIRDESGTCVTSMEFFKKFDVSLAAAGTFSINTGLINEVFPYSLSALDSTQKNDDFVVVLNADAYATMAGTVSVANNATAVVGVSTNFLTSLSAGDLVQLAANNVYTVATVTDDTHATLSSAVTPALTGVGIRKYFKQGQVLNMSGVGTSGDDRSISLSSSTVANFDIKETLDGTKSASVICRLRRTTAQEAKKSRRASRYVRLNLSTHEANTIGPWCLGFADVFQINSVRTDSTTFSASTQGTDVSQYFELVPGQKDTMYGLSYLRKKQNSTYSPTGHLLVNFDYFSHDTSQGSGYFSVDSYPIDDVNGMANTSAIATADIPVFISPTSGISYDLRNCIDARSFATATGTDSITVGSSSTNPSSTVTLSVPSGGLHSLVPDSLMEFDLSQYLGRIDIVTVDTAGNFGVVRGNPAISPRSPVASDNTMSLAKIQVPPFPSLTSQAAQGYSAGKDYVQPSKLAARGYTMRAIGTLDQRITNLEYYVSLSLLETDTKNMTIVDAAGNNRFKNGILVDPFVGTDVGDTSNPEWKCAIDGANKQLRPQAEIARTEMDYDAVNSSNVVRAPSDVRLTINSLTAFEEGETVYQGATIGTATALGTLRRLSGTFLYVENVTGVFVADTVVRGQASAYTSTVTAVKTPTPGSLVTLPYTHEIFAENPFATQSRNTSGGMYNWKGSMSLFPPVDTWIDTTQLPDVEATAFSDTWTDLDSEEALGTVWGSWTMTLSGIPGSDLAARLATGVTNTVTNTFTRTGTQTTATETETQTESETSHIDGLSPYMRSRPVLFYAQGLKPGARVYPFFDGTNVSQYCSPFTQWSVTTNGELDLSGNGLAIPAAYLPGNVIGTYSNTDSTTITLGLDLVSSVNGDLAGVFYIPSSSSLKFTNGSKILRLTDSSTNSSLLGEVTTSAEAAYWAGGLVETKQKTILTTRGVEYVTSTVTETRTQVVLMQGVDPIAQSFSVKIADDGVLGIFLTKLDLFFETKDETSTIEIEIREMGNDNSVTQNAVPLSRAILQPSDIVTSADGSLATQIWFPAPILLQNNTDYAFVIRPSGANPNFRVWVSQLGETDLVTGTRVTTQPYSGMLFLSSNDKTYSPVQDEDIKFRLYCAAFSTTTTGNLRLRNRPQENLAIANTTALFTRGGEPIHGETRITYSVGTGSPAIGYKVRGLTSLANGIITDISSSTFRVKDVPTTAKFETSIGETIALYYANGTSTGTSLTSSAVSTPRGCMHQFTTNNQRDTSPTVNKFRMYITDLVNTPFEAGEQLTGQMDGAIAYIED